MAILVSGRIPELLFDDALRALEISDLRINLDETDPDQSLTFTDIDARVNHETRERLRLEQEENRRKRKEVRDKKIKARKKKGKKKKRFNRPSTQRPRSRPSHAQ